MKSMGEIAEREWRRCPLKTVTFLLGLALLMPVYAPAITGTHLVNSCKEPFQNADGTLNKYAHVHLLCTGAVGIISDVVLGSRVTTVDVGGKIMVITRLTENVGEHDIQEALANDDTPDESPFITGAGCNAPSRLDQNHIR